ncbi:hypothetical protein D8674_036979 [Pyrus ussuriensis x Pyrus communis]|uniref:O-fucosyltransferase family protein n=1 Tax=Pyrus ussuriensis x Pyrus communis TaxID=2448454 RepID=A0A5N5GWM1_9ROSA|nr:hypothetical protein D8674_036979 [Pyrus ussuriensis x Pyrus communis]
MHPYNRLPSSGHNSPSPPPSPLRSPRFRHGRSKPGGRFNQPGRTLIQRIVWHLLSVLIRRQGFFLFAPLLYIAGMLLYMGSVSFEVVPVISHRLAPGSVYRSPQLYAKLRPEMDADNSSADAISTVWKHSYKSGEWRPCVNKSSGGLADSNGYIYVEANGGLNQQRTSICNAVAVAGYLNATLVIPKFHFHSIWRDPSNFSEIYDEDYFISMLENDVRVVDKIPEYLMERFDHNMTNVYNFRIKAWSPILYYEDVVLPRLLEEKVIRISPFANRLSFDSPPAVQRLRCLANYEALKFSSPILTLGEVLVVRMKERSTNYGGKYISVHLRFEEDMVAFSCCVFDGGGQENEDMKAARERGWKGKFTKPGRVIRPGAIRVNGKCPLTPLEVGLMLRGMGFDKNTFIYLASGKIYNAEKSMAPLLEMFPNLQTKEMLASEEELAPFKNYSSRMAAIDYTVCLHSEVFVTTQGGNFPHFLIGHRRYMYGGHSKTIRPDKRKLALLFDNPQIGWKTFKRHLLGMRSHSDSKGYEIKRPNDSIYTFPCPDYAMGIVGSLSPDQLQTFHSQGYLVMESFASAEDIEAMRNRMDQLLQDFDCSSTASIFSTTNQKSTDNYFYDSVDKISFFFEEKAFGSDGELRQPKELSINKVGHALHELDPVFKGFTFSEKVSGLFISLGYRRPIVIQSMYIFKQPGIGGEVVPHQDNSFLYTDPPTCTGLWLALEDATITNGCLWAIPGSQKNGLVRRFIRGEDGVTFDRPSPEYDQKDFVPIEVKAGSLVVIHGDLIHQSFENQSSKSRHAYSLHVVDTDGCRWSQDNWIRRKVEPEPLYVSSSDLKLDL